MIITVVTALFCASTTAQDEERLFQEALKLSSLKECASQLKSWKLAQDLRAMKSARASEIEARLWLAAEVWPLACEAAAERKRTDPRFSLQGLTPKEADFDRSVDMTEGGIRHAVYSLRGKPPADLSLSQHYVVFYPDLGPPSVYATRPDGVWMKAEFQEWDRVYLLRFTLPFGNLGAATTCRPFERVRSEATEIRARLFTAMFQKDVVRIGEALADLADVASAAPSHTGFMRDIAVGSVAYFLNASDLESRRKVARLLLKSLGDFPPVDPKLQPEDLPALRSKVLAALDLKNYSLALACLERLPDNDENRNVRRRFEAMAPGRLARGDFVKLQWGWDCEAFRCEPPESADPAGVWYGSISGWRSPLPTTAVVVRAGTGTERRYFLDINCLGWTMRVADFGTTRPDAEKLAEQLQTTLGLLTGWNECDCEWRSEVFFKYADYWWRALDKERVFDYAAAIPVYDDLLKAAPGLYEALAHRMYASRKGSDWKAVLRDSREILRTSPGRVPAWEAIAAAHEALKDPAVLEDYTHLIALGAGSPTLYEQRARYRRDTLKDSVGALADFGKAIELAGWGRSRLVRERAELYRSLGRIPEALEDCTAALNKEPKWELYFLRSDLRRQQGETSGADEDYRRGCELDLGGAYYDYTSRADDREKRSDLKGALEDCAKALDHCGDNARATADIYRKRVGLYEKIGDLNAAARDLGRAAMVQPSYEAYVQLADYWRKLENEYKAQEQERQALEAPIGYWRKDAPDEAYAWRASGRRTRGDLAGALEDYGRAIESAKSEAARAQYVSDRNLIFLELGDLKGLMTEIDEQLKRTEGWELRLTRAELLRDLGRDQAAEAEYRKAIELPVKKGEYSSRASRRASWGDLEGGFEDATRALEEQSSDWVRISRGSYALALGKFDEAARDFEAGGSWDTSTWTLRLAGKSEAANAAFERAVARPEKGYWDLQSIVNALDAGGETERALTLVEAALTAPWAAAERERLLLLRRGLLIAKGGLTAAGKLDDEWIARTPTVEAFIRRADLRLASGDLEGARKDLASAAAIDLRHDSQKLAGRARLRLSHGDAAGAAEDARKSCSLSPLGQRFEMQSLRAECLLRTADTKGALAVWDEAIRFRASWRALLGRARARLGAGDREGCKSDLEKSLTIAVRTHELPERSRLRARAGDREGAEADCSRYLALLGTTPGSYSVWVARAYLRLDLGRETEALADAETGAERARLEGREARAWALLSLAWLRACIGDNRAVADAEAAASLDRRSGALALRGLLKREVRDLDQALRRSPIDPWTLKLIARGKLALGDLAAAESIVRRVLDTDPTDAEGWIVLADVLYVRGDVQSSRGACDRASSLDPENRRLRKEWERIRAGLDKRK